MGIDSLTQNIANVVKENPVTTAVGVGAAVVGGAVLGAAIIGGTSKKKARKSRTKRGRNRDRLFKSKQKHERKYKRKRKYKVYGKKGYINPKRHKKMKSRKGIHYTKNGQPYKILSSGKARFIKRKGRK